MKRNLVAPSRRDVIALQQRLKRRTTELAAANHQLQRGILRRKRVESNLTKSDEYHAGMLKDSLRLQESLRQWTRQVLTAHEAGRKAISRKLQNEIAQTLLAINVRLLALKQVARVNTKGLKNEIASTQRLVARSVRSVRRVAREFRRL